MKPEDDKLIVDHEYDGIQELDNPLPGWWLATFYGTIIFSFLYYIHYSFTGAPNLQQELATTMASIQEMKSKSAPLVFSESELEKKLTPETVQQGRAVYLAKCSACHAENGGGMIGPNLTDPAWIHGEGKLADLYKVIAEGVADKGMPAWGEMLKSEELLSVVSYVASLRNSNVAGGKPAQGKVSP